jgi:hypothetical protein
MLNSTPIKAEPMPANIPKRMTMCMLLILCLLSFESFHAAAQDSNFVLLRLPFNVSMRVPRNWWRIDGDLNQAIATNAEALINLAGMKMPRGKQNIFRANSMPRSTYAGIAINIEDSDLSPIDVQKATDNELREIGVFMHDMFKRSTVGTGMSIIGEFKVRKETVDGQPALIYDYERSGAKGPVRVRVINFYISQKELAITLSYRMSEATLWKPVIDYMHKTIRVGKGSGTP